MTTLLRNALEHTARYFSLAAPTVARRQAKKVLRARIYLAERGLSATARNSTFQYARATSALLGKDHTV